MDYEYQSSFIWYDFKWTANIIKESYDENSSLATSECIELQFYELKLQFRRAHTKATWNKA